MRDNVWDEVYTPVDRQMIAQYLDVEQKNTSPADVLKDPRVLTEVEVLLASWGAPRLDDQLLERAPRLKAVFYAAGSVRPLVSEAFLAKNIVLVSARDIIADRVASFTHALVHLSLKGVWHYASQAKRQMTWPEQVPTPGTIGSTVGVLSLGAAGRAVVERLSGERFSLLAYDPYADASFVREHGISLVDLVELFSRSHVVTLHAPLLAATKAMVGRDLINRMQPGATLINTARGGLIDETALVDVLRERTDLFAFLDVTDPEPPAMGSPLFTLPNIVMTPHIAGNVGRERRALGSAIAEEVRRWRLGQFLRLAVDTSLLAISA